MPENKAVVGRIETKENLLDQVVAVMTLSGDTRGMFPSGAVRQDFAARLDHIHKHYRG
jgi:hypothetical protein